MSKKKSDENESKEEDRIKLLERFKQIEEQIKNDSIDINQLYSWFKEEIERKDNEIARLKKDNDVLFRTALKARQSQVDDDISKKN